MMGVLNKKAGAVAPAPAPESAGVVTPTANHYSESGDAANAKAAGQPRNRRQRGEPAIAAKGPLGRFVVTGQSARALVALVKAGKAGVTALEVNS